MFAFSGSPGADPLIVERAGVSSAVLYGKLKGGKRRVHAKKQDALKASEFSGPEGGKTQNEHDSEHYGDIDHQGRVYPE